MAFMEASTRSAASADNAHSASVVAGQPSVSDSGNAWASPAVSSGGRHMEDAIAPLSSRIPEVSFQSLTQALDGLDLVIYLFNQPSAVDVQTWNRQVWANQAGLAHDKMDLQAWIASGWRRWEQSSAAVRQTCVDAHDIVQIHGRTYTKARTIYVGGMPSHVFVSMSPVVVHELPAVLTQLGECPNALSLTVMVSQVDKLTDGPVVRACDPDRELPLLSADTVSIFGVLAGVFGSVLGKVGEAADPECGHRSEAPLQDQVQVLWPYDRPPRLVHGGLCGQVLAERNQVISLEPCRIGTQMGSLWSPSLAIFVSLPIHWEQRGSIAFLQLEIPMNGNDPRQWEPGSEARLAHHCLSQAACGIATFSVEGETVISQNPMASRLGIPTRLLDLFIDEVGALEAMREWFKERGIAQPWGPADVRSQYGRVFAVTVSMALCPLNGLGSHIYVVTLLDVTAQRQRASYMLSAVASIVDATFDGRLFIVVGVRLIILAADKKAAHVFGLPALDGLDCLELVNGEDEAWRFQHWVRQLEQPCSVASRITVTCQRLTSIVEVEFCGVALGDSEVCLALALRDGYGIDPAPLCAPAALEAYTTASQALLVREGKATSLSLSDSEFTLGALQLEDEIRPNNASMLSVASTKLSL